MAINDSTVLSNLDHIDGIHERLKQVKGICALASISKEHPDEIYDEALVDAMWAARRLLDEAYELADKIELTVRHQTQQAG